MKVLYVTATDSSDPNSENNAYYFGRGLEACGYDLTRFSARSTSLVEKAIFGPIKMAYRAFGRDFRAAVEPAVVRRQVSELGQMIDNLQPDLVVANAPLVVSGLDASVPYVIYTDAPITALMRMGHYYDRWPKRSRRAFVDLDRTAVEGAKLVIYHSKWAADSAAQDYSVSAGKLRVVLPGANISPVPNEAVIADKPVGSECRLLFWGRDWQRKGGPLALEVARELRLRGVKSQLVIGGPRSLPAEVNGLEFVTFLGRVSKASTEGTASLEEIFQPVDYMLLPTRADTSTSAIREAAAFGIPSLVSDVGGLSELVEHGDSGFVFDRDASAGAYVDAIIENWSNEGRRVAMRQRARHVYERDLNWDVAGSRIGHYLSDVV